nr:immunoglobulin heavy chain junction region [Macaca mulatta]
CANGGPVVLTDLDYW